MRGILTVCRKEVVDNARERRTLFSTLIFGPLFGPILFAVLINVMINQSINSAESPLDVPIVNAELAPHLVEFLAARRIRDRGDSGLSSLEQAAQSIRDRAHDIVIVIDPQFDEAFAGLGTARVTLVFDQSNTRAASRVQRARNVLSAYAAQLGRLRLLARGVHPKVLQPLIVDDLDVSTPAGRSVLLLGMLTYFLLLATLMGGFYLAIDTTAGERERNSLEPLLTTPVTRGALLLGKMCATACYMLLSMALTLAAFTVVLRFVPLERLGMSSAFRIVTAVEILAVLAPFVPLGAALMTLVASFTRTYKEAQTYLTLVLIVPTLPLVFATILNVRAAPALMWIPSLSQHLLITTLIRQEPVTPSMVAISAGSALLAAAVLALAAIRLYERERLLG